MDSSDIMHHVLKLKFSLEWINYTIMEIVQGLPKILKVNLQI
jgi:hypothetical protein